MNTYTWYVYRWWWRKRRWKRQRKIPQARTKYIEVNKSFFHSLSLLLLLAFKGYVQLPNGMSVCLNFLNRHLFGKHFDMYKVHVEYTLHHFSPTHNKILDINNAWNVRSKITFIWAEEKNARVRTIVRI